jgi:hypothetical protein
MKINKFSEINSRKINESNSDDKIRSVVKIALENMYMFGGMPKPDPKYDDYLNRLIESIMIEIKKEYGEKNTVKIAFDDEIKYKLQRYLQNTIWSNGGMEDRIDKLMELHSKFINNVRDKMSADEIAKRLFEYEKNILNQK